MNEEFDDPINDETRWQAVVERDRSFVGQFIFGVRSTGIYCRPGCPARTPRREQVQFFQSSSQAAQAGYRPCRRCRPDEAATGLAWVERAARLMDEAGAPLSLAELGRQLGLSPSHLQRAFKAVTGLTPRQYAASRRLERFKEGVRQGDQVTGAMYSAGFGSPSRLYERAARQLGMAPAVYRHGGSGMTIRFSIFNTPLGWLLLAATAAGICKVAFGPDAPSLESSLAAEFPRAALHRDDAGLAEWAGAVQDHLAGIRPSLDLPLDVQATAFQHQVWAALRQVPYGETRTYAQLAQAIGQPRAVRAVARACATNPAALVTPCHRIVRSDGGLGGYRWGVERKKALLAREKQSKARP